jgi:hypothetical protein
MKKIGRGMFCAADDIRNALYAKLSGRDKILESSLAAFEYGIACAERGKDG